MPNDLGITTIQSTIFWEDKEANLKMFEEKIHSVPAPAHIILLPEMFSTGFSMEPERLAEKMDGPSIRWMKKVAAAKKAVLTGSLIIEEEDHYYNRLVWMLPNGQCGFYDKRHRFGYAGEDLRYSSGSKRLITSVNGWKLNLMICYDLRFPVWSRQSSPVIPELSETTAEQSGEPEFDVLIYVANWPEKRNHAWKTLLQARAIENQCFVAGVNRVGVDGNNIYYSGDSMVVDPLGETLYSMAHAEDIQTTWLPYAQLEEIRKKYPFLKDADNFLIET